MRPLRLGALVFLCLLLAPTAALAHPLGNFTVNHYSRIEPAGDGVQVFYVLDLAEIPTFQEQPNIDADRDGQVSEAEGEQYAQRRAEELRRNLRLRLDGAPTELETVSRALSFPPGQAGLPTLRLEAVYRAALPSGGGPIELSYRDDNDPTRIGWREMVARPGTAGAQIQQSSVPADDLTDALRSYPEDLLNSPADVREARLTFVPGVVAADPWASAEGLRAFEPRSDVYAQLAAAGTQSLPIALLYLGFAMVLGAGHALSPGHGKTVVAAYLIGSRGTARHALFLGLTVTATHTLGVYALGLVTLFLSQYILPERLYPPLQALSGLMVVGIGGWLFLTRLRGALAQRRASAQHSHEGEHEHVHHDDHEYAHDRRHAHDHSHADASEPARAVALAAVGASGRLGHEDTGYHMTTRADHGHEHAQDSGHLPHGQHGGLVHSHGGRPHSHLPPGADGRPVTWRSLLALGVSGGLLPCPSALVVLLSAIALHQVAFGLLLIVSFSIGLASVLVGIGLLLVYARRFLQRLSPGGGAAGRLLPVASALVIMVLGAAITLQALPGPI